MVRTENKNENKPGRGEKQHRGDQKDSFQSKDARKEESQNIEKLISVRRVTKVVKGGKNMRFSALCVVGDGKGKIAFASAKAREVPDAVKKASGKATKNMKKIPLRYGKTLHHDYGHRKCAARVCLRSAKPGTGVIAGGPMRAIFEAMGVQDVVAKSLGTNNNQNVVSATIHALTRMESPRHVAKRRGLTIAEINKRRRTVLTKTWSENEETHN